MKKIFLAAVGILIAGAGHGFCADEAGQQFQAFNLEGYSQNGEKAWVVNGETADILGSQIKISNVDAEAYGEEKVNLTAETGVIDQSSGDMHLEKDVVVTSEKGTQLLTDSLNWKRNEDLVETRDDVLIKDEKFTAAGTGMQAHPGLKTAQIEQDVTVTMETEPLKEEGSKTLTITCDGPMIIDHAKSFVVFNENVVAVQDNQTLTADKMEVYFDQEMKTVKDMICIGHVVIIRGENKSYADKAVYNGAEQRLVLSGRPKLILMTEGQGAITSIGN